MLFNFISSSLQWVQENTLVFLLVLAVTYLLLFKETQPTFVENSPTCSGNWKIEGGKNDLHFKYNGSTMFKFSNKGELSIGNNNWSIAPDTDNLVFQKNGLNKAMLTQDGEFSLFYENNFHHRFDKHGGILFKQPEGKDGIYLMHEHNELIIKKTPEKHLHEVWNGNTLINAPKLGKSILGHNKDGELVTFNNDGVETGRIDKEGQLTLFNSGGIHHRFDKYGCTLLNRPGVDNAQHYLWIGKEVFAIKRPSADQSAVPWDGKTVILHEDGVHRFYAGGVEQGHINKDTLSFYRYWSHLADRYY